MSSPHDPARGGMGAPGAFGAKPWQQQSWDARAAGNFMGGGAGTGLLVFTVLSGVQGPLRIGLLLLGLGLVGLGLLCVWAEIGRPLRALHVFFNPYTSWMSREAAVAPLLFASGLGALLEVPAAATALLVLALAFLYCQARILQASKGIPAWREPLTVPLLIATGLAEGGGLFWAAAAWTDAGIPPVHTGALAALWWGWAALLAARFALGIQWHRRLSRVLGTRALAAVNQCGHGLNGGSLLPLALLLGLLAAPMAPTWAALVLTAAGLLALAGGAAFKFMLITRAAYNQGFALPHLPVRGARRRS
jgi:phenylacetyl-CoA:acceptor oxidoreductase subunit 2